MTMALISLMLFIAVLTIRQVKLVVCEEWARLKSPKEQENFVTANILGLLNADTIEAILQ